MAVSAPLLVILAVQAVPTLLSCLTFTSGVSPLLLVGSVPFSVLFVTLSVLISVCSWCCSPHEGGVFSVDENDDANCTSSRTLHIDCSRVSSKLSNWSWWSCGEAPRGLQLAMLFLAWALLFLLLCMPPMVNAEIGTVQADTERLTSLGDGPDTISSSEGPIREVTSKDPNELDTGSQNSDNGGPERRHNGPVPNNNAVEEQGSVVGSSGRSDEFGHPDGHHSPALDGKVELQSCRALVRAGQLVTCGASPVSSPALEAGFSDLSRDCSKEPQTPDAPPLVPSQLEFGMQPLYQRQVAFLTIMNSCNGSKLSLLAAKSDNRQFIVTGFSAKLVAPGGTLTLPVCYLPQYVGAARGSITIETGVDPLVVQLHGEGVESLYQMHVRVHANSHYVISLFNPFNETLFVEEVVVSPETDDEGGASVDTSAARDRVISEPIVDDIVLEAQEGSSRHDGNGDASSSQNGHGLLMRAGETWELPAQMAKDIVDFNLLLEPGEVFQGAFQIQVAGATLEGKGVTLVYPFSSRVSRPSPVLSVPDTLDFGMLVGDQASSQPLILQNSGEQLVQVEEIYEVPGDPRIAIDYEKGHILKPGIETEVANITFSGQNQPHESNACRRSQKVVVRTNSTMGPLVEVAYRAIVLQCLDSPPAMAFVTGGTGRTVGDLGGSHTGQGITDLLMDYKLFMGLLICGLVLSALVFFQVVVHDTELPTISGDLGKGGCHHRRSNSRVSPFIKKRDKLLKMWGWGALATVVDGIWAAFGSTIWSKDCSTPNLDYSLPRSVTLLSQTTPAQNATVMPSPKLSTGGAGASGGSGAPQAGGRKGSSDRKNNNSGAARADQVRNGKGNAETGHGGGFSVTTKDPSHHPPSVKQPKSSKFLRSENTSTKHSSFVESLVVDADCVVAKDVGSVAPPPQDTEPVQATIAPALSPGPSVDSSVKESVAKNASTFSSVVPVAQKMQPPASPCAPPVVERERRRRKKKSLRHDVASNNLGTTSPASPASPVTPSASAWPVSSPPSPEKKSDQSTASLSPRSSGSVDLADAAPLRKLKVKVLHSLKVSNPVPGGCSGTESPRRNTAASTPLQQPRLQGKAADHHHRKQSLLERGPGVGKRSNISEWAAIARKKTPGTGYNSKGPDAAAVDGSQSYRASRHSHRGGNAYAVSEDGPAPVAACFTTSASFPRLGSRQGGGWVNPPCEFGIGTRIDSFDTSIVPPPAIAPALRAPGAKITKQAAAASEPGWTSLGFTASPELPAVDRELLAGAPWQASSLLSAQSSGELVYDIWGNHFGNLSQCSSNPESSQPGFDKEVVDPVNGFHRLLVPDHNHHHSEVLFAGTGFAGDMSPTAQALYASFSGFFSEGSTLGLDDSRPGSPACVQDLPDQLYPSDVPSGGGSSLGAPKLGFFSGQASSSSAMCAKPRVRVPYSPPMGCVATTAFTTTSSAAAFSSSPLSTPTAASCSFWAHDNSKAPERVASPALSLT